MPGRRRLRRVAEDGSSSALVSEHPSDAALSSRLADDATRAAQVDKLAWRFARLAASRASQSCQRRRQPSANTHGRVAPRAPSSSIRTRRSYIPSACTAPQRARFGGPHHLHHLLHLLHLHHFHHFHHSAWEHISEPGPAERSERRVESNTRDAHA